ncbi:ATP-binding SpoIIE family protein phosphatase [Thaumasiovibrio subtropicus]|uniref:ATP-binding SpoIIE family protein phosphatase n=1 Tax=Thaumasiovibrio subtropicus TaxID=1891207 RepID=UPI000B352E6A|nr:SpoIIE family protein phosphatase [Thaumasiovibrio subtropicus]
MRVLIVDDQKINQEIFSDMLRSLADTIHVCDDGQQAVDYLEETENLPDIILMDVMMPVKDGFEAAKEIRSKFSQRHMPILFLTVLDDRDSFGRCLLYGDDFILKPVGRSTLIAKVQAHYRTAKIHNEVARQRDELSTFREQVKYDYAIAESIFANLMENTSKSIPGIDFITTPSTVFNGDLIVVANRPQGGAYVMIADATGHGLPAAISTIPASRAFFTMAAKGMALGEIAIEVNRSLVGFLPVGMMMAASLIEISANGLDVSWWGGGLPDGFLLDSEGNIVNALTSTHMPLGVLSAKEFEADLVHFRLEAGQQLVFYTDGLTEAADKHGEQFGEQRLKAALDGTKTPVIPTLLEAVNGFTPETKQDDLSILSLTFPVCNQDAVTEPLDPAFISGLAIKSQLYFDKDALQSLVVMAEVRQFLSGILSGGSDLDLLCSVLSELFANATEHGLLGLDSKIKDDEDGFLVYYQLREERLAQLSDDAYLALDVKYLPNKCQLVMSLKQSAGGFRSDDFEVTKESEDAHGRGILLVSELCDSVRYSEEGTRVTVVYQIGGQTQI